MDQIPSEGEGKPKSFSALMGEYRRSGDTDVALSIKRKIKDMDRRERDSLVRSFDVHRPNNEDVFALPAVEHINDVARVQMTEPASNENHEMSISHNNRYVPDRMRKRREAHAAGLGTTDSVKDTDVSVKPVVETKEAEAKPVEVESEKVESRSPEGLVDMETFGADGEPQTIQRPKDNNIGTFESPVSSKAFPITTPRVGDNASRAKAAVNEPTIAGQGRVSPKITPEQLSQAEEGTSATKNVDADLGNDNSQENQNTQNAETATPATNSTVATKEAPVVTIDQKPNPTILAQTGGAPTEATVSNAKETDTATATLPPAELSSNESDGQNVADGATEIPVVYQPSGEQRVAENIKEADGAKRIARAKAFINNDQLEQEIKDETAHAAETAIAPEPETPGYQEPPQQEAKVTVDGEGVIGRIEPAEKNQTVEVASAQPPEAGQQTVIGRIEPVAAAEEAPQAKPQSLLSRVLGIGKNPNAKSDQINQISRERFKINPETKTNNQKAA